MGAGDSPARRVRDEGDRPCSRRSSGTGTVSRGGRLCLCRFSIQQAPSKAPDNALPPGRSLPSRSMLPSVFDGNMNTKRGPALAESVGSICSWNLRGFEVYPRRWLSAGDGGIPGGGWLDRGLGTRYCTPRVSRMFYHLCSLPGTKSAQLSQFELSSLQICLMVSS
jgi:hypothetical protein